MRWLFGVVVVFALGWSGWWWFGSSAKETALETWLEERRAAGWVAEYSDLKVQGFPNRFDTKITDIMLADLRAAWAWSAPEFQILALSYRPNHVIAAWPGEQVISTPDENITVTSSEMRASVKFQPDTSLALETSTLEIHDLALESNQGWASTMDKAIFATRQTEGEDFAHDIALKGSNWVPSIKFKNKVDPSGALPEAFDSLDIQTTAAFDAPWDRVAVEGAQPMLNRLDINVFSAQWGVMQLEATGSVTIDAAGYPTGKVSVRAKNWQEMLDLAISSGAMNKSLARTLETGLKLVARLSGNKDTLDAPLSFKDRRMSIGPIPIGDAPQLWQAQQN